MTNHLIATSLLLIGETFVTCVHVFRKLLENMAIESVIFYVVDNIIKVI